MFAVLFLFFEFCVCKTHKTQSDAQDAPTDDTRGIMVTTIQLKLSRSRGDGGGYDSRQGCGKGCGREQGFDEE